MGTRWTMNYLAGPLTRVQIPALNRLLGVEKSAAQSSSAPDAASAKPVQTASTGQSAAGFTTTKPKAPAGISEVVLPNNLTYQESAARQKASPRRAKPK